MPPESKTQKTPWSKPILFPDQLPISQRREEIADAITNHQVVILAGETGSGKTTQLPKICLSLGYGTKGLIGHTQPRRIAARTVADRIASELKTNLGETVGYQVRFKDVSSEQTRIKLMTDGVLLAEFQRDRALSRYEVIIIDEAHERSLNIDFLLGLLKTLCKKRPELKVIITSATIDLEKFARHFSSQSKAAPIIEVSGRTYPVETLYQPPERDGPELPDLITKTVATVIRNEAKGVYKASGDILVFCAGEREIRDAAQALRRAQLPIEVLPLYSRLSVSEQNRAFQKAQRRKVVLATNVAETSITVPGIAYVIDPGVARISRYSFRSKIQRLPIEAVSQASANQRLGRCGRVSNGVCIRLYSEDDFISRAEFTPAEILRSNLASVILKMLRLGIRDIQQFEFIDKPDNRLLNDGFKLLQELDAIDQDRRLTKTGRQMSDLPVDPRYARILVAAQQHGCLRDALVLISVLSIQDPRERPADKQQAADQQHNILKHGQSDFFSYLYLWQAINDYRADLSNTKFKQLCVERYWSIARIFEWRELYRQLTSTCKNLGWTLDTWHKLNLPDTVKNTDKHPKKKSEKTTKTITDTKFDSRYETIHKVLLSGLMGNVATKELDERYLATRGRTISLFPGSALAKRKPKWIIAADFLETSKVFAHTVAEIRPEWILTAARHLCKYTFSSPHYHARSGMVKALRKTLFQGLLLNDKESVNYGPINPQEAHQIFIQQALLEAQYRPPSNNNFLIYNQSLIGDIEKLETKTRRRNLLADEQIVYEFYAERIPTEINNRSHFETWLSQGENEARDQSLRLDRDTILTNEINSQEVAQFPDQIEVHGKAVSIEYKFNPGQAQDGVTMVIPIEVLAPFPDHLGDWLVAGLLREKCVALIKTLPKNIRRNFAPAIDTIDQIRPNLIPSNTSLAEVLAELLFKSKGIKVKAEMFDINKLDNFYQMNYRVLDVDGSLVEEDRNLARLKQHYADAVQNSVHAEHAPERVRFELHDITEWDFGSLDDTITYQHQGMTVLAYPMLKINDENTLSLLVCDQIEYAKYHTHRAILKLAQLSLSNTSQKQSYRYLQKELLKKSGHKAAGGLNSLASQLNSATPALTKKTSSKSDWLEELIIASLQQSCFPNGTNSIRNAQQFKQALEFGAKNWVSRAIELETALLKALGERDKLLLTINKTSAKTLAIDTALEDIKAQLYRLFEPHFLRCTPLAELKQYPRYLRAIEARLEKIKFVSKTANEETALQYYQNLFDEKIGQFEFGLEYAYLNIPELKAFSVLLEEWRVSLFAQQLRTQFPVSEKRISKAWQALSNT